jgi:hypothetical protein
VLTPNLIYHRLGRRGRCCGCFPQVSRLLVEHGILVRDRIARGEMPASEEDAAEPALARTA